MRAATSNADKPEADSDPPLDQITIATADPTVPPSPPPPPSALPRGLEWQRKHPHDELCQRAFAGKDVLTCMRLEHRLLDWLWERYREVEDPDRLQRIVHEMRQLLLQHATCEERAVYEVVAKESESGALLVQQLTKDHFALRGALYRLEALTVNDEGFGLYVSWSYRHYAAHADREEREVALRAPPAPLHCSDAAASPQPIPRTAVRVLQLLPLLQRKSAQELLDMGVEWNVTRTTITDRSATATPPPLSPTFSWSSSLRPTPSSVSTLDAVACRPPDSLYSPEAMQWVRERLDSKEGAAGGSTPAPSPSSFTAAHTAVHSTFSKGARAASVGCGVEGCAL